MAIEAHLSIEGADVLCIKFTEELPHPVNNNVAHALTSAGHVRALQWKDGNNLHWVGKYDPRVEIDLAKIGDLLTIHGIEATLA